jgi:hypothetical protein
MLTSGVKEIPIDERFALGNSQSPSKKTKVK